MTKETILVVDDNAMNVKLLNVLLTKEGYEVKTAADAAQTLKALEDLRPALILMDLQLPGVDGFELTRRIKKRSDLKRTRIVAVTSYAMRGDEERALAAGCDGYLAKPIDTRTIGAVVRSFLSPAGRGARA